MLETVPTTEEFMQNLRNATKSETNTSEEIPKKNSRKFQYDILEKQINEDNENNGEDEETRPCLRNFV